MNTRREPRDHERPLQRGSARGRRGNRVFYVAVEGEQTEPDYLSLINREFGDAHQFQIHTLSRRNGLGPRAVVELVRRKKEEDGNDDESQYWALFDRDQHPDIGEAMRAARNARIRVAFSHPSFDLWLLLHFIPVHERQRGRSGWVHDKLREQQGFERFGAGNGEKSVRGGRETALAGRHDVAARHARRLVDDCPTGRCSAGTDHAPNCDPLARDPSTDVWRLLMELGVVE